MQTPKNPTLIMTAGVSSSTDSPDLHLHISSAMAVIAFGGNLYHAPTFPQKARRDVWFCGLLTVQSANLACSILTRNDGKENETKSHSRITHSAAPEDIGGLK